MGGGGELPFKRLMGMCRLMGSHFHAWIEYNGVPLSTELLERVAHFRIFWGLESSSYLRLANVYQNVCTVREKGANSCFTITYLTD